MALQDQIKCEQDKPNPVSDNHHPLHDKKVMPTKGHHFSYFTQPKIISRSNFEAVFAVCSEES